MAGSPEFLIIPAAGLGLRMQKVSTGMPKEMLPIGGKPAIQYAVIEGLSAGIEEIIIIINSRKEVIRRYFEDRAFRKEAFPRAYREMEAVDDSCRIHFLYQETQGGEWDAISYADRMVGDSALMILLPDNIYFPAPGALAILKESYQAHASDVIALTSVDEESARGFGNSGRVDTTPLSSDLFRLERCYPKGEGTFALRYPGELRTCGISAFGPHLFECIERARDGVAPGEEFTDVSVRSLMLQEREILGCRLPGRLFDIGNPSGYRLCLSHIGDER